MPYLAKTKTKTKKRVSDNRAARAKIYATIRWRRLRCLYLVEHPLCEFCLALGEIKPAIDIHHKIGLNADKERRFDWTNLIALCKEHHQWLHRRGETDGLNLAAEVAAWKAEH